MKGLGKNKKVGEEEEPPVVTKRDALKTMIGQAKLMEIIDASYENGKTCENCAALADWWEKYGAELPTPGVPQIGPTRRTR